jgi:hypothetical protein
MDPPFTRDRLRNLRNEITEKAREEIIDKIINQLKDGIISCVLTGHGISHGRGKNPNEFAVSVVSANKAVIKYSQISYSVSHSFPSHLQIQMNNRELTPAAIVQRLKKMFPDCVFEEDPLKTYVTIDWS